MNWRDHFWHGVPVARERIEDIVKRAGSPCRIIDAGCNDGFLSQALIEAGHTVVSVDNNDTAISKAKEQFGIDVVKADVNELPFKDDEFDIAIGGEVLEHLPNPGAGLKELFRVSRNRVIISLPIGAYWLGEPTHIWQINACVIEHDQGIREELIKKALVIEFLKRPIEAKG